MRRPIVTRRPASPATAGEGAGEENVKPGPSEPQGNGSAMEKLALALKDLSGEAQPMVSYELGFTLQPAPYESLRVVVGVSNVPLSVLETDEGKERLAEVLLSAAGIVENEVSRQLDEALKTNGQKKGRKQS